MNLQITWFILVALLLTVYAVLDGFDLGAGFWHIFAKKNERGKILSAIGPFWDGNEVWLLTGGGALFAAFPNVYATVFSGFYLALMLLLLALIFRAVSVEFRNKVSSEKWKTFWDYAFWLGSTVPALLLGVAIGNILNGIPLDIKGNYTAGFFALLNPYSLLIGLLGLFMFASHGALYLSAKTAGDFSEKAKKWARFAWSMEASLFILMILLTIVTKPHLFENFRQVKLLWLVPAITTLSLIFTYRAGFISSIITIAGLMTMAAIAIFPNLVPASNDPQFSLNIYNASSSILTLKTMFIIALIGMPIVICYTIWAYVKFKGKVEEEY